MPSRFACLSAVLVAVAVAPGCRERAPERAARAEARDTPVPVAASASAAPPALAAPRASESESDAGAELIEVSGSELVARVTRSGHKAVIVNAWASWCGPCRREMPMLLGLKTNLEPRGIGVELVSVDEPEARPQAVAFLKEHGAPLPSYVAERPLGPFKLALHPRWPGMLPASFLFDSAGKLRYFWGGPVYEDELLEVVDRLLAGTLVDGEARFGLMPGKVED